MLSLGHRSPIRSTGPQTSMATQGLRLQFFDLFLDAKLLELQSRDLMIGRSRSCHLLLDASVENPVFLGKLCEMG